MEGFILNPDRAIADAIMDGLYAKDGYCPCVFEKPEGKLCPCEEFINEKICHCGLYVKIED
jgi:ferredoxin-thioredoxin reductase catalytic subunit